MKKLFYLLLFLCPVIAFAQQGWIKSYPLEYMWMCVGNAAFSAGEAQYISLAFSPSDGHPYIAYSDDANSPKATVMKFDGCIWINVGSAGFSAEEAFYTSLAFNPSGQPYVAFYDLGDSGKETVMKFDGTNWVNVGNAGFSAGETDYTSLAFSPSGKPYVTYGDFHYGGKTTVMKYDSVMVGINEQQETRLSLYPNPATDKITIEASSEPTKSQLTISSISGQALITHQITEPKTQLDISDLPRGVYFVRVTDDRAVSVGKFIKE